MAKTPTDEEMRKLMVGAEQPPEEGDSAQQNMPDPEPEILEKAQQIIDGVKEGEKFSDLQEGDDAKRAIKLDKNPEYDPDVTNPEKVAFMAHLFGDKPFVKSYELLGGRLCILFTTISADLDAYLSDLIIAAEDQGARKETRKARYKLYLLAASIKDIIVDGNSVFSELFIDRSSVERSLLEHEAWVKSLSREDFQVLRDSFDDFKNRLDFLLGKVKDPVFWRTP